MTSFIWDVFDVKETDETKALCTLPNCTQREFVRGKTKKDFSTKNLWNHLESKHKPTFKDIKEKDAARSKDKKYAAKRKMQQYQLDTAAKQPKISEMFERSVPYKGNSNEQKCHEACVAEWLCDQMLPYTTVDADTYQKMMLNANSRLNCRSEKHYRTSVIPKIYEKLLSRIQLLMSDEENVKFIVVTVDFWTSESRDSYMSLTAHFINKEWERKMVVVDCIPSNESHTADNIAQTLRDAFTKWNLHGRVHLVVRDNAQNLVNALGINKLDTFGCFLHTLNLIVNHSIIKRVGELLDRAQSLTKYFRLKKPEKRFKEAQVQHPDVPANALLLAEPTRWNTYYFQLKRQLEQQHAVMLACSWLNASETNSKQPPKIPDSDWQLIENVLKLLEPVYITSNLCEREDSCISEVIPHVNKTMCRITNAEFVGNKTSDCTKMQKELLFQFEKYFCGGDDRELFRDVEKMDCCLLATILDPRFKNDPFRSLSNACWSKVRLELTLNEQMASGSSTPRRSNSGGKNEHAASAAYFSEIMNSRRSNNVEITPTEKNEKLVQEYLKEEPQMDADPLLYWKVNSKKYKKLAELARKYLSAPIGSVASERSFKAAKSISEGDRASLLPENVEQLLFCKYNLKAVNFCYD